MNSKTQEIISYILLVCSHKICFTPHPPTKISPRNGAAQPYDNMETNTAEKDDSNVNEKVTNKAMVMGNEVETHEHSDA